jgi:NADPH-dependent curcumin reductase CurA
MIKVTQIQKLDGVMENRQILFAKTPVGAVKPSDFEFRDAALPAPGGGDVLIRNIYLSCDPYMRSRMDPSSGYGTYFDLGKVLPARVVGQVHESRNPDFKTGDFVWGFLGWELYTLVSGGKGLRIIDPSLGPISHAITVLGMPGRTAEVGIYDLSNPQPGETVYVSAACGAVGQVVGQLAKMKGCRAVGSAGSEAKVAHLIDNLGYDAAFNYKTVPSIAAALDENCPDGIDIYFDNVGGETLAAVLERINDGARIPVCGQISQYDLESRQNPVDQSALLENANATLEKFSIYKHMDAFDAFPPRMSAWMKDGKIVYYEDIVEGLDNAPDAFIKMMAGENLGKRLVRVGDDPTL